MLRLHTVFFTHEFPKLTREQIMATMPPGYVEVYGTDKLREIWDACELQIETASTPEAQRTTWSDYKQRNTAKLLGGGAT